ncbi:hypothetical protein GALMADRAFT_146885 [Galerina marginata CBS 339.88]|uniref:Uncharacterized protein n=1 Tax=Galerina marginata (strain CBS 339.88) TaxID=685588 RepID=A0A067SJJ9_GALM3|nr:hypothetical protein GALMADRAFT_146885 [Galerina marginata CBS 339.88]
MQAAPGVASPTAHPPPHDVVNATQPTIRRRTHPLPTSLSTPANSPIDVRSRVDFIPRPVYSHFPPTIQRAERRVLNARAQGKAWGGGHPLLPSTTIVDTCPTAMAVYAVPRRRQDHDMSLQCQSPRFDSNGTSPTLLCPLSKVQNGGRRIRAREFRPPPAPPFTFEYTPTPTWCDTPHRTQSTQTRTGGFGGKSWKTGRCRILEPRLLPVSLLLTRRRRLRGHGNKEQGSNDDDEGRTAAVWQVDELS